MATTTSTTASSIGVDNTVFHPTDLTSRYEIRRLGPEHSEWATAIAMHSNLYHSAIFSVCYPSNKIKHFNIGMHEAAYLVDHQIASGMSFGVFDTEYVYKHASSSPSHGAFLYDYSSRDPSEEQSRLTGTDILERMDFPLVSIALAYDAINALDLARIQPMIELLPLYGVIFRVMNELDPRTEESWAPTGPGQVLMRNATATRRDYEGRGLMAALARFLMREASAKGFKGIQIESLSDSLTHVWMHPPAPFKGTVFGQTSAATYEEKDEKTGEMVKPFAPSKQQITRIWVALA